MNLITKDTLFNTNNYLYQGSFIETIWWLIEDTNAVMVCPTRNSLPK